MDKEDLNNLKDQWLKRSKSIVMPYMMDEWKQELDDALAASSPISQYVKRHQVELALDVMERLHNGEPVEDVARHLDQLRENDPVDIWRECWQASSYAYKYAERGVDFYRAYNFNRVNPITKHELFLSALKQYEVETIMASEKGRSIPEIIFELSNTNEPSPSIRGDFSEIQATAKKVYKHLEAAGKTDLKEPDFLAKTARALFLGIDIWDLKEAVSSNAPNGTLAQELANQQIKRTLQKWATLCAGEDSTILNEIDIYKTDISVLFVAQEAKAIISKASAQTTENKETYPPDTATMKVMLSIIDQIIEPEKEKGNVMDKESRTSLLEQWLQHSEGIVLPYMMEEWEEELTIVANIEDPDLFNEKKQQIELALDLMERLHTEDKVEDVENYLRTLKSNDGYYFASEFPNVQPDEAKTPNAGIFIGHLHRHFQDGKRNTQAKYNGAIAYALKYSEKGVDLYAKHHFRSKPPEHQGKVLSIALKKYEIGILNGNKDNAKSFAEVFHETIEQFGVEKAPYHMTIGATTKMMETYNRIAAAEGREPLQPISTDQPISTYFTQIYTLDVKDGRASEVSIRQLLSVEVYRATDRTIQFGVDEKILESAQKARDMIWLAQAAYDENTPPYKRVQTEAALEFIEAVIQTELCKEMQVGDSVLEETAPTPPNQTTKHLNESSDVLDGTYTPPSSIGSTKNERNIHDENEQTAGDDGAI